MATTVLAVALAGSVLMVAGLPNLNSDVHVRAVTHKPAAVKTTTTPKPASCVQCADLNCFTSPLIVKCAAKVTYCSTVVTDTSDGNRKIVKGCSSTASCQTGYISTKAQTRCRGIDHQVSGYDITCTFCCKGDNCNAGPHLTPTGGVPFTTVG